MRGLFPLSYTLPEVALSILGVHVPGRCISLRVRDPRAMKYSSVHIVHNYSFPGRGMARVGAAIQSGIESVRSNEIHCAMIPTGDFNSHPEDEGKRIINPPKYFILNLITRI